MRLAHRPTITGLDTLPPDRPYLLIANHSAGLGLSELACFAGLYLDALGPQRPLAGFAHPFSFTQRPTNTILRGLGCVPSTYEAAGQTLEAGVPLLIFPGGSHETLRPIWQANRVDLAGRKGFLRIARAHHIPIYPMGIRGSHYTAPMLIRSRALAWLLIVPRLVFGEKRWGVSLLGLLGAIALCTAPLTWPLGPLLAYLFLGSPLSLLPIIPATIRFTIGAPLAPDALFAGEPDEAQLARALEAVQRALQELVTCPSTPSDR
jgi:1-acyl-sn-glycerol-3-phosphate acyltransferase